jgi:hypothetical protein
LLDSLRLYHEYTITPKENKILSAISSKTRQSLGKNSNILTASAAQKLPNDPKRVELPTPLTQWKVYLKAQKTNRVRVNLCGFAEWEGCPEGGSPTWWKILKSHAKKSKQGLFL